MTTVEPENTKSGGAFEKAKGKAKEIAGDVTNNPARKIEGREEQTLGEREMHRAEKDKRDLERRNP